MIRKLPLLYGIGMTTPASPGGLWKSVDSIEEATALVFSPKVSFKKAESVLISHPVVGIPAYYWGRAPVDFSREVKVGVIDIDGLTASALAAILGVPPTGVVTWEIPASSEEMEMFYPVLNTFLSNIIEQNGEPWKVGVLLPSLREGIENGARHGCNWTSWERVRVKVVYKSRSLTVEVTDAGTGFDWKSAIDYATYTSPADIARDRGIDKPGGMGMPMMIRALDRVYYNDKGNTLTMQKLSEAEKNAANLSQTDDLSPPDSPRPVSKPIEDSVNMSF